MAAPFSYPLTAGTYRLSSGYRTPDRPDHRGIDFAAPLKTPIYAAADGVVVDSRSGVTGFGCWIVLDHFVGAKKVSTVYGHMYLADLLVQKGQTVTKGQLISRVGNNGQSFGAHLHFETWEGGRLTGGYDVDPALYLNPAPAPIPEELTVAQYDEIMAKLEIMHNEMRWLLIGGNPPGRNNFNWIADQITAAREALVAAVARITPPPGG